MKKYKFLCNNKRCIKTYSLLNCRFIEKKDLKTKNQETKKNKTKETKETKETKKNKVSGEIGPGPKIGFLVFSRVSCFWGSAAGWPVLAVRWPGLVWGLRLPGAWQLAGLAGLPPLGLSAGPPPCLPGLLVRICLIHKGFE